MSCNKRKQVIICMEIKLAIQRIDNNESVKEVAKDIGIRAVIVGNRKRRETNSKIPVQKIAIAVYEIY